MRMLNSGLEDFGNMRLTAFSTIELTSKTLLSNAGRRCSSFCCSSDPWPGSPTHKKMHEMNARECKI